MGGRRLRSSGLSSRRSPFPAPARRTRIPLRATQGSVRGSGGLHLVHTRRELRRSLRLSTTEGIVAELVGACASGATLTAWALYLGLAPVLVGLLGALPFIAQLVQIPSAWLTHVHGSRRTALWTIGVARQLPLALAFLPWLPLSQAEQRAVLLAIAAAASLLGVAGNNAWTTWMGELVPDRLRGRYFGRRTAFCALGSTLGALGAGLALDHARPGAGAAAVLSLLAIASCGFGAVTSLLLARQHEPGGAAPARGASLAARDRRAAVRSAAGGTGAGVVLAPHERLSARHAVVPPRGVRSRRRPRDRRGVCIRRRSRARPSRAARSRRSARGR